MGHAGGTIEIKNCRSSVILESTHEGSGGLGGLIAYQRASATTDILIEDSIFDGSVLGSTAYGFSGIAGGRNAKVPGRLRLKNVFFAPGEMTIQSREGYTISVCKNDRILDGFYYTRQFGENQGGIRVYESVSENHIYRGINAVNDRTYYIDCTVGEFADEFDYTGYELQPHCSVSDNEGQALSEGEDYFIRFSDEKGENVTAVKDAGQYTMTISGNEARGIYGTYSKAFAVRIVPAEKPVITAQPQDLRLTYGDVSGNTLSLQAGVPAGHILSCQWYRNDRASAEGRELLIGCDSSELVIDTLSDVGSQYYYFCEVTSTRMAGGETESLLSDFALVSIARKAVTVTAKDQSVEKGGEITEGEDQAELAGALEGHELAAITLTSSGTDQATTAGTITPSDAVIMSGEDDVTENYDITYVPGTLTVTQKDDPGDDDPGKDDPLAGMIHETVTTGVKDEKGNDIVVDIYYDKSVSYNGRKHVAKNLFTSNKKTDADITVSINSSLSEYAAFKLKFRNNKFAVVKNGKNPQFTISYKANKGASKQTKAAVKAVNKGLKSRPFIFTIERADLTGAKILEFKESKGKVKKLTVEINGVTLKLSKKDFDAVANADGTYTITGKGNFTGTLTK